MSEYSLKDQVNALRSQMIFIYTFYVILVFFDDYSLSLSKVMLLVH